MCPVTERPKRYRIDGEQVDIRWRAALRRFKDGYPTAGRYTPETGKARAVIEIAPGQTFEDERRSLLHEMLHDCADRGGVRAFMKLKDEELFVTAVEAWLFRALEQNPDVIAWLTERRPE